MGSQKSNGRFYHVVVMLRGSEAKKALFVDMGAKELRWRFVRPYK